MNSLVYDNRPMTQQLMLSSSSSSSTSSNTTSPSQSHYSSSASSSHEKHQNPTETTITTAATKPNQADFLVTRINSLNIRTNASSSSTKSDKLALMNGDYMPSANPNSASKQVDKGFTEVSYEFLGDLSKSHIDSLNAAKKRPLAHSKSFTRNKPAAPESNEHRTSGFTNPFCRSNISKSFSAFTTRLKYQTMLSENGGKKPAPINVLPELSESRMVTPNQFLYEQLSACTANSLILNSRSGGLNTAASPLPSPTLSTCSNSSSSNSNTSSSNGAITISDTHIISSL